MDGFLQRLFLNFFSNQNISTLQNLCLSINKNVGFFVYIFGILFKLTSLTFRGMSWHVRSDETLLRVTCK